MYYKGGIKKERNQHSENFEQATTSFFRRALRSKRTWFIHFQIFWHVANTYLME